MMTKSPLQSLARTWAVRVGVVLALAAAGGGAWLAFSAPSSASISDRKEAAQPKPHPPQPVRAIRAQQQAIQAWIFAEGTARSVNRQYLTFDRAGRVVYVKPGADGGDLRAGETVRQGDLLARLDRRQYEAEIESAAAAVEEARSQRAVADSDIRQADTQYELAAAKFRRIEKLTKTRATSQAEFEEAEAEMQNADAGKDAARAKVQALEAGIASAEARLRQSQLALEETEITSPIDGVLAYLNIKEGFYFTQTNIRTTSESDALQTLPIVVIDPTEYEITVDIPSYEAHQLQPGQEVLLIPGGLSATSAVSQEVASDTARSFQAEPPWKAKGSVFSINPAVNPGGRSVQLKIRTTLGADEVRDGMFVACWIKVEEKADAVAAPFDAFLFEENRPYVFVIDSDEGAPDRGKVRRVPIRMGIESLNAREIASGVAPNELLVTDGRYRLVDQAHVRITNADELPPPRPVVVSTANRPQ
ncbi:efflux RND transporter periplasmic adaptor subunit [Lignipirellula cremea]|uniref:Multidrug resistance protein MdtA n=1 Tax=Lignipirellula cremea TaxID=2528010 RepID=A0A518DL70_9BACT|nr:hypothetical protein [Lignipirellula cremea]QDU92583.1 Multidrug resistance protein MdtA precursor [Lignipirellula cremea]